MLQHRQCFLASPLFHQLDRVLRGTRAIGNCRLRRCLSACDNNWTSKQEQQRAAIASHSQSSLYLNVVQALSPANFFTIPSRDLDRAVPRGYQVAFGIAHYQPHQITPRSHVEAGSDLDRGRLLPICSLIGHMYLHSLLPASHHVAVVINLNYARTWSPPAVDAE
jgi:hypothetical protein